jgi:transcriptional regulator with XRE-family HTH domain
MTSPSSPEVQRRRLAAELRRLRGERRKTADEVGRVLGWSKAKISRYELARGGLKPADVARLLEFYGVEGADRDQLLALAEAATHKGWWEGYSDILTEGHVAFISLEAEATSLREWQINVVPGLLQTEQYSREVLSGYSKLRPVPPMASRRRVETRRIRQQILTRDDPLKLEAVLDESVLHRQRGDRPVMHAQLLHLADVSEQPNVTIRILPFDKNHGLAVDSFAILKFGQGEEEVLRDVVSIEHLSNELYFEGENDTFMFILAFDLLKGESLAPEESRELILDIAARAWS